MAQDSQWTVDTLHEHLMSVINANEIKTYNTFDAHEKAVTKAEVANEKRFEGVNEFRAQLSDQANTFLPRAEFDRAIQSLTEKIEDLKASRDAGSGKSLGLNNVWGYALTIIGLGVAIFLGLHK